MDKNKSLNEVVEAICLEQEDKSFGKSKVFTSPKIPLQSKILQQKKLSYSKLFSYLGSGVKESPYVVYDSEKSIQKLHILNSKKKSPITYKEIVEVVKISKISRILGRHFNILPPRLKENFDNFKIFNQQYIMLMYQIVGM